MKSRDIIYMIYNEIEQSVTSSGIEFREFINCLPVEPKHILLLASGYLGGDYHPELRLDYVRNEHLNDLYKENVYSYGDFCWVDFDEIGSLDQLEPHEKAELLYLGHYKQPLGNPFFEKLDNRFVYLAHDDGWFNRVFFKDINQSINMLRHLIPHKLTAYRRHVPPLSMDTGEQLMLLARDGILIELSRIIKARNSVEIPFTIIGQNMDFDDVYNNMERHKTKAKAEYWLVHCKNEWVIRMQKCGKE
ncbi:hypothetical protein PSTEL_22255 [Paenibacillus stellifer]|uniref:Peptide ABC transporter permease n=1 Tax=Paenibacillus stellifer TaxID=169760 RepID=A0A089M1V0_9BACL|nr:hypothetical protein [Paenibacillus stellifer]AIQ65428.1 hypothetical protein PSTEL_22255 [Paenibacillus stellifer]